MPRHYAPGQRVTFWKVDVWSDDRSTRLASIPADDKKHAQWFAALARFNGANGPIWIYDPFGDPTEWL